MVFNRNLQPCGNEIAISNLGFNIKTKATFRAPNKI